VLGEPLPPQFPDGRFRTAPTPEPVQQVATDRPGRPGPVRGRAW